VVDLCELQEAPLAEQRNGSEFPLAHFNCSLFTQFWRETLYEITSFSDECLDSRSKILKLS